VVQVGEGEGAPVGVEGLAKAAALLAEALAFPVGLVLYG